MIREMMFGALPFKESLLSVLNNKKISFKNAPDWDFIENNRFYYTQIQTDEPASFHYKIQIEDKIMEGDIIADDYQDVIRKLNLSNTPIGNNDFLIIEPNANLSRHLRDKDYAKILAEYDRVQKVIDELFLSINKQNFFTRIEYQGSLVLFIADDLVAALDANWMDLIEKKEQNTKELYIGNVEFYFDKIGKSLGLMYDLSELGFEGNTKNEFADFILHTKPQVAKELLIEMLKKELTSILDIILFNKKRIENKEVYYKTFYSAFQNKNFLIADINEMTPFIARMNVKVSSQIKLDYTLFVGIHTGGRSLHKLKSAYYDFMQSKTYSKFRLVPTDINKQSIFIQCCMQRYIFFPIIETHNNGSAYRLSDKSELFPFTADKRVDEVDAKIILFGNKDQSFENLSPQEGENCQKAIDDLIKLFTLYFPSKEIDIKDYFDNLIEKTNQQVSPFNLREELDGQYFVKCWNK